MRGQFYAYCVPWIRPAFTPPNTRRLGAQPSKAKSETRVVVGILTKASRVQPKNAMRPRLPVPHGSVTCDSVGGNVSAGGSVTCDDVGGSVSAGSNVTCDSVGGDVRANSVQCEDVSGGVFRMN